MIHKKRKKNASFGFYSHTQGRFRPFPACFGLFPACFGRFPACFGHIGSIGRRPIRPDMADTARFWPNQPDSTRIKADSTRIEPHRRESSRVGANPRKKKKNQTRSDARATASDAASRVAPRPCFLVAAPCLCVYIYIYIFFFFSIFDNNLKRKKFVLPIYFLGKYVMSVNSPN